MILINNNKWKKISEMVPKKNFEKILLRKYKINPDFVLINIKFLNWNWLIIIIVWIIFNFIQSMIHIALIFNGLCNLYEQLFVFTINDKYLLMCQQIVNEI